jgi:UDP-glucose 4-epimerase
MRVLVTGGAGYIGSHTVLDLLEAGHEVTVVDDLSNSSPIALERVATLAGRGADLVIADVTDKGALAAAFGGRDIQSVIHFAGLKAVGESWERPLDYWRVNVGGSITLLEVMADHDVFDLVFSSSATVYGAAEQVPVTEGAPTSSTNPYGRTKLVVEQLLEDARAGDDRWSIARLRYFNPVGAHPSGEIGEDPDDIPNNLMPFITQVGVRRQPYLRVFGGDYDTPDGTGVRDYIHVEDLAEGHIAALSKVTGTRGLHTWNLGTGRGTSVLELVGAFESATGTEIPYEVVDRRPGDVAALWADPTAAERDLGWRATRSLEEMCADAWRWQTRNPDGYEPA